MDDLTKGCIVICLWAAIFSGGLIIACRVNKPLGIVIMLTDALCLYIKLRAQTEVQAERRRRRRYEQQQWRYAEEAHEDEK